MYTLKLDIHLSGRLRANKLFLWVQTDVRKRWLCRVTKSEVKKGESPIVATVEGETGAKREDGKI